jgi:hypothetical protein
MIRVAIIVKVLVRPSFNPDYIDLYTGDKGIVENSPVAEVLKFGPDESASFSGFYMLKFNDRPKVVVMFDAQSIPEISGSSHKYKMLMVV